MTIRNPAYDEAKYSLRLIYRDDPKLTNQRFFEPRFNVTPPMEVWQDHKRFNQWVADNAIPEFIQSTDQQSK